ncbi:MAG: DUF6198 family protein [Acetatifactor sp.]|nr:DUF6198 family protein [Acetatifactor sp.]
MKKTIYTELSYVIGMFTLAFSVALMERADFGMSMVVAPAYLLHLKVSQYRSFFSFGMAEYVLQAFLLIVLSLVVRKLKKGFLFSFVTAVLYGLVLDLCIKVVSYLPCEGFVWRLGFYLFGIVFCCVGVSFFFHTYISPEAYELFVKEIADKLKAPISKVKTIYDCSSCAVAILMSFLFFGFGHFEGVKLGTVFCALVNGWLIGRISALLDRTFEFKDALKLRKFFTE